MGQIIKLDEFFMLFSEAPKMSEKKLIQSKDPKSGKDVFVIDPNQ